MGCQTSKLSAHDAPVAVANPIGSAPAAQLSAQIAEKDQQIADQKQQIADQKQQLAEKDQQIADQKQQLAALNQGSKESGEAKEKSFNNGLGPRLKRWVRQDTPSQSAAVQEQKQQLDAAQEKKELSIALLESASGGLQAAVQSFLVVGELKRLREVVDQGNELYLGMYSNIIQKVRNNDGYEDFCRELAAIELAADRFPQRTADILVIYETAGTALPLFEAVLQEIERGVACETRPAPLKKIFRVLQKQATRFDGAPSLDCRRACDIVRGSVVCPGMDGLLGALRMLVRMHRAGAIAIVRVKDRFSHPTPAGWADAMINFVCRGSDHVCELQLIQGDMLKARKEFGGHQAYAATREAAELLEFAVMALLREMKAPVAQMCAVLGAAPVGCDARHQGHAIVHDVAQRQGMPETVGGLTLTQLLDERQLAFGDMDEAACTALGAYVGNNLQLHKIIFPSGIEMESTVAKLDLSSKRLQPTDAALLAAFLPRW
jgi:hypothetical protein